MSLILGRRCPLLIAAAKRSFTQSLVRGFSSYSSDNDRQKIALVVGSSGCLGRSVVQHLRKDLGMQVVGADVVPSPKDDGGASLDKYIQLPTFSQPAAVSDVTAALVEGLSSALADDEEIDAIICVAGGWKGDPPLPRPDCSNEEFMTSIKEYGDTINSMLEMNLYPVLAAGYAANRFMADEGLFVAIGATVALSATPGMLAYGMSKAGTHHFLQTLGETTGKAATTRSKRQKARRLRKNSEYLDTLSVVGILPTTIDTPSNRKAMPDADFDTWTKPTDIAREIGTWIEKPPLRPHSGALVKVHPAKGGGAAFTLAR